MHHYFRLTLCLIAVSFLFPLASLQGQTIDDYFQKIRKNEAELTAFIAAMPKGGDLHNHYTGSVYAESYFNWLVEADGCVNLQTLETTRGGGLTCPPGFRKFSGLYATMKNSDFNLLRSRLIRFWSTKEYDQVHNDAREEHFFATFGNFNAPSGLNFSRGLQELKNRAMAENLSYLEVMFTNIRCELPDSTIDAISTMDSLMYYNFRLLDVSKSRDPKFLLPLLEYLYQRITGSFPIEKASNRTNRFIDSLHLNFIGNDPPFTMRYLAFVLRTGDPLSTLVNTITAFETVNRSASGNLVGLNIVAPEDDPVSMRDYWLHMQIFGFCHAKYPNVKYTMHAGELTEGVVPPEELTWHINSAVYDAGAMRIGHGVDIAYENNSYGLLKHMASKPVPVEINLLSNEFILGVKDDKHPILLYKHFKVPIVISTDDPGVSRTSLTEQYVLLAKRYDEISYRDIKSYVYNSITYSFLSPADKEKLKKDLDKRFRVFEEYVMQNKP